MEIRRYIRIGEIILALILLTLVLTKILELLIALLIMIAFQFILGNVVYPLVYKKYQENFTKIVESYNTSLDIELHSHQEVVKESKIIYSKFYTMLFYFIVISLSVIFVLYGTMFLLGRFEYFDNWYLLIGIYILAPLYLFGMSKLLSFKTKFNQNELIGYTKSSLEYNVPFKKGSVDLSNVTTMSFIENKLIDHMKYITIIEFVLKDESKVYFNLLFYSRKNRDKIMNTLKKSLVFDDN